MTPEKILSAYERGILTSHEAIGKLCLLALEFDPATFATLLPTEWLNYLRERTVRIPEPEEVIFLRSWCGGEPSEQWLAEERAEKERYVAGLRTWKAYFDAH